MLDSDMIILEINLELEVDGERKSLTIPIPFDYDGQAILQLLKEDLLPIPSIPGDRGILPKTLDALEIPSDDGVVELAGAMSASKYSDWKLRADDLQAIDWEADTLEETGLLPGEWPGILDERSDEPTELMLDETIDHDLNNATIVSNDSKAAFRAMRETSGASQSALAEALRINPRTVKRWETPGQLEPPSDARSLVEAWRNDAVAGANWHVHQAESLRYEFHEAYILTIYRSQEEFDRILSPILAQAPSYRWQDALSEARDEDIAAGGDGSHLEIDRPYTNFPGTRSYWRANAAARLAAVMMDALQIPYGFSYVDELKPGWGGASVWVPRADIQRSETTTGTMIRCGMR